MQIYSEDFVVLSSASAGRLFLWSHSKKWYSVNVVYQWKGNSLQVFFKSFGRYIEISRIRAGDSFSGILFPLFRHSTRPDQDDIRHMFHPASLHP